MDLINKIFSLQDQLRSEVKLMNKYGMELAEAKREYYIKRASEELEERERGVPATLIKDLSKGVTADYRFKVDCAEVMYQTAQESINATKLIIKCLEEQVKREWAQNG